MYFKVISFAVFVGLLSGALTLSNYTRQLYQVQVDAATEFYGENKTLIAQLVNQVYVDSIVPPPDPVNDHLSWFKLVSQVRKYPKDMFF